MEHFSKHIKTALQPLILIVVVLFFNQCSSENTTLVPKPESSPAPQPQPQPVNKKVSYIALGDSYTIGQSVCVSCRFPEQLKKNLETTIPGLTIDLKIIAQTGWATSNLINVIKEQQPTNNYNLVTLLIGVNNQYQSREFGIYEREFPQLVKTGHINFMGIKQKVFPF